MTRPAFRSTPIAGRPWGDAVHATAITIAGFGLLIFGASGAGKSRLAAALIAGSTRRRPICLVGDDRILLATQATGIRARPHPRIAGFLERRGLGIVACPFVDEAPVSGAVRLDLPMPMSAAAPGGSKTPQLDAAQNFFGLPLVIIDRTRPTDFQRDAVLDWWRDACTTPAVKTSPRARSGSKK